MNYRSFDPKTSTRRNFKRLPSYDYRSSGAYFVTICTEKCQRVLEIPAHVHFWGKGELMCYFDLVNEYEA